MDAGIARPSAPQNEDKAALRLWLRLLSCTTLLEQQLRSRLRQHFGITLPQFDVLAELDRLGEPQTMTELSRHLMVSNGNLTGVVDRLERDGLVERRPSQTDRRVLHLALTPSGRQRFQEVAQAHERWLIDAFRELPPADMAELSRLLGKTRHLVRRNIDDKQRETTE